MLSINCISAFIEKRARKSKFFLLFETLLGFKLPRFMATFYRNQKEWAWSRIRCNIPFAIKGIITPIQTETVSRSPRFIGSLVSSFATIIADTIKVSCSYLPKLFTITNPFQVLPPNTLLLRRNFDKNSVVTRLRFLNSCSCEATCT